MPANRYFAEPLDCGGWIIQDADGEIMGGRKIVFLDKTSAVAMIRLMLRAPELQEKAACDLRACLLHPIPAERDGEAKTARSNDAVPS